MFGATEASALSTILAHFWPALLTEIAVIAYVASARRRNARPGLRGRRLRERSLDTAGLWCLPLYVWAYQANLLLGEAFSSPENLASMPRLYERTMVTIFVALFYLLMLQTIGAIITHEAPATLGMTGYSRTAATAAMLSVFLNGAFFVWILSEGVRPHGLLFPLR